MSDRLYYIVMIILAIFAVCFVTTVIVNACGMPTASAVAVATRSVPCEASEPVEAVPEMFEAETEVETTVPTYTDAELMDYISEVCGEYGVPVELVCAIIEVESGWDAEAVSATNDHGIMQINACNHASLAAALGITDWYDARQNILAGVYLLAAPCAAYGDDYARIAMCYNLGCRRANELWESGVFETAYSRKVMEAMG